MFVKKELKALNIYTEQTNYYNLLLLISGMFTYGGTFPEYLKSEYIENLILHKGMIAILNKSVTPDKKYKIGYISGYELNDYGEPEEGSKADFYTRMNEYGEFEIGKDIIIGFNNRLRLPDLKILETSANLTEIEKSKRIATIMTRFSKIPIVRDGSEKTALDVVINDIVEGKLSSIVRDNFLDIVNETNGELKTLGLTDPEEVDKLQYIYKAHDDEMRAFLEFYGQTYNATSKMAQVTTDELQGGINYSKIIPSNMLECRQRMIDKVNSTWGENWTVDYSEPWKHLKEKPKTEATEETDDENFDVENDEGGETDNVE